MGKPSPFDAVNKNKEKTPSESLIDKDSMSKIVSEAKTPKALPKVSRRNSKQDETRTLKASFEKQSVPSQKDARASIYTAGPKSILTSSMKTSKKRGVSHA